MTLARHRCKRQWWQRSNTHGLRHDGTVALRRGGRWTLLPKMCCGTVSKAHVGGFLSVSFMKEAQKPAAKLDGDRPVCRCCSQPSRVDTRLLDNDAAVSVFFTPHTPFTRCGIRSFMPFHSTVCHRLPVPHKAKAAPPSQSTDRICHCLQRNCRFGCDKRRTKRTQFPPLYFTSFFPLFLAFPPLPLPLSPSLPHSLSFDHTLVSIPLSPSHLFPTSIHNVSFDRPHFLRWQVVQGRQGGCRTLHPHQEYD